MRGLRVLLKESLLIYRQLGNEAGIAAVLNTLDEAQGERLVGGELAREAHEIAHRLEAPYLIAPTSLNLGVAALRDSDPQAAGPLLATALRNYQLSDNPIFSCEAIELIAELVEDSDPEAAARLLGGTAAFRARNNVEWQGYHAPRAKRLDTRLSLRYGPDRYAELRTSGAELDLHGLVIEALSAAQKAGQSSARPVAIDPAVPKLTARELAVLRLLATGKTDREIGIELFISPKTANRHVANIFAKLECHNRPAATTRAHQLGFV